MNLYCRTRELAQKYPVAADQLKVEVDLAQETVLVQVSGKRFSAIVI